MACFNSAWQIKNVQTFLYLELISRSHLELEPRRSRLGAPSPQVELVSSAIMLYGVPHHSGWHISHIFEEMCKLWDSF